MIEIYKIYLIFKLIGKCKRQYTPLKYAPEVAKLRKRLQQYFWNIS